MHIDWKCQLDTQLPTFGSGMDFLQRFALQLFVASRALLVMIIAADDAPLEQNIEFSSMCWRSTLLCHTCYKIVEFKVTVENCTRKNKDISL